MKGTLFFAGFVLFVCGVVQLDLLALACFGASVALFALAEECHD